MSYRCNICRAVAPEGQPRLTYLQYRQAAPPRLPPGVKPPNRPPRRDIAREWAVCSDCHWDLTHGITLAQLLEAQGVETPVRPPVSAPIAWGPVTVGGVSLDTSSYRNALKEATSCVNRLERMEPTPLPRCDLCGKLAGEGQVTAEATLCRACLRKANGGSR